MKVWKNPSKAKLKTISLIPYLAAQTAQKVKYMFLNVASKLTVLKAGSVISQFIGTFIIICCSGWIHMGLISSWDLDKWWVLPRPVWVQNKTENILGEKKKHCQIVNILGLEKIHFLAQTNANFSEAVGR